MFLVLAVLPGVVGTVGTVRMAEEMAEALQNVNPADRMFISALGFRESLTARAVGGGFSAALLALTGLGLGVGALVARLFHRGSRSAPWGSTAALCGTLALAIASLGVLVRAPGVHRRRHGDTAPRRRWGADDGGANATPGAVGGGLE